MTNMNLRISFKAGCDGFPGFIKLDRQLLHTFMSISGMSQRPADGDPLSLPFFPLQQLLAGISPTEEEIPLPDVSHDAISTLDICLPETLQVLPEDERWLIEESDLNRRPQQLLADELGITLTAFKSRLLRAKEAMTELCQIEADDASPVCCHKKMN